MAAAEILQLVAENELLRRTNIDISEKLENSISETEEMTRLNEITMHMVTVRSNQQYFPLIITNLCILFLPVTIARSLSM